ncbi:FAD binding domain-containing protein [Niallia sp. 01092]|uniref:FAD binding domain-containing protein n=1 Tax=unclassified Niallia TaxID=2837522 RepID=UPI003FD07D4B
METDYYQTIVDIPITLVKAKKVYESNSILISGGTLLQLNWEAGIERPSHLISMEKIIELAGIKEISEAGVRYLEIGAATVLAECCKNSLVLEHAKVLSDACSKIGAPAVRNRGTIGGNICSEVGDSIPALLVLDAQLNIYNGEKQYVVSIKEWLQTKKEANILELITTIRIPIQTQKEGVHYFFQKLGRRESFTAAIISVSGYIKKANAKIEEARLAIGGGAHQPVRLESAEKMLLHRNTGNLDFAPIYQAIENGFVSYSDPFVTERYRRKVAANIFFAQCKSIFNQD